MQVLEGTVEAKLHNLSSDELLGAVNWYSL